MRELSQIDAKLLSMSMGERREFLGSLSDAEVLALRHDWRMNARPSQIIDPVEGVTTHAIIAGRGFGKTHSGASTVIENHYHAERIGGRSRQGPGDMSWGDGVESVIAGRTANDVNETMIHGKSGIMTLAPPWFKPRHLVSKKILKWPNKSITRILTGEKPAAFRGPNPALAWLDETPHWQYPQDCWDNLKHSLRSGVAPWVLMTTTPLSTNFMIRVLFEIDAVTGMPIEDSSHPTGYRPKKGVRIITGSTYDNASNLAESFMEEMIDNYEGTEVGEREMRGRIRLTPKGSMWTAEDFRRIDEDQLPEMAMKVVMVDPSVAEEGDQAECGIVVAGLGMDDNVYILEDASGHMTPGEWARKSLEMYENHSCDKIILEENNGGGLLGKNIEDENRGSGLWLDIETVRATRSKHRRAQTASASWERGHVIHVGDRSKFAKIEYQMTHTDFSGAKPVGPGGLMDRLDAIVWVVLFFFYEGNDQAKLKALGNHAKLAEVMGAR